jgi:hypothetical protein
MGLRGSWVGTLLGPEGTGAVSALAGALFSLRTGKAIAAYAAMFMSGAARILRSE